MDFSEKISIILKTNKLQLVTKEDLSEYCGFHRDTIRKAIDRKTGLKEKYLRIFQDKLGINPDWWDAGKGDIYVSKPTQEVKNDQPALSREERLIATLERAVDSLSEQNMELIQIVKNLTGKVPVSNSGE